MSACAVHTVYMYMWVCTGKQLMKGITAAQIYDCMQVQIFMDLQ